MEELTKKTLFITGGSRGIGLAIALRFAREGANVVIAAKEDKNKNLKKAVEQVIQVGGQALVLDIDLCNDDDIKRAVKEAVSHFNTIDVLINNASAFHFGDTLHTSSQQFDLLIATGVRATFLTSQACLPFLKIASNPHIINISPPLNMESKWFKKHLAFSLSKYGMSICTLGMSAEFGDMGVAVNSLWPQTTIATSTIKDHFLSEVYAGSRWPSIVADATYELTQFDSSKYNGQFFTDEGLLRQVGIEDFSHYAVNPNAPLIQDLYVDDTHSQRIMSKLVDGLYLDKNE